MTPPLFRMTNVHGWRLEYELHSVYAIVARAQEILAAFEDVEDPGELLELRDQAVDAYKTFHADVALFCSRMAALAANYPIETRLLT